MDWGMSTDATETPAAKSPQNLRVSFVKLVAMVSVGLGWIWEECVGQRNRQDEIFCAQRPRSAWNKVKLESAR